MGGLPHTRRDMIAGELVNHKAFTESAAIDAENPSSEREMEEFITAGAGITAETDASIVTENPQLGAARAENAEETDVAIVTENPHDKVMNDIWEKIQNLSPPPSNKICIYRVPETFRDIGEEFYTPVVVSIGPYHHDNPNFLFMENCKLRYFQTFIEQSNVSLERYVELMKKKEERARANYAETIEMSSDEFVTMMLVDGCFILELIQSRDVCLATEVNEFIFSKNWLITRILLDLILLENQIPFFILESIYHLALPHGEPKNNLYQSILNFFNSGPDILNSFQNNQNKSPADFKNVLHLTDLIRKLYLPDTDFSQSQNLPPSDSEIKFVYTATQLLEAGVKFKAGSSKCLLDVKFNGRVLEFPRLMLQHETEYIFRNLMALDVCHYSHATPIMDYAVFLDSLIDTPNDVDLLVKNGMLYNGVGSTSEAADIVNKLCTEITYYSKKSYLIPVCKDLNAYYNLPMNR